MKPCGVDLQPAAFTDFHYTRLLRHVNKYRAIDEIVDQHHISIAETRATAT